MDENVLKMLKNRAIFFYSISIMGGGTLQISEQFLMILYCFIKTYWDKHQDLFKLIYIFEKDADDDLIINEKKEWNAILMGYFTELNNDNLRIYDEVGYDTVKKISELTELFGKYLEKCEKVSKEMIKKRGMLN